MARYHSFDVIEGGKSEVLSKYNDLFVGKTEVPKERMNELFRDMVLLERHEVFERFPTKVLKPFDQLLAVVRRINDLDVQLFGSLSEKYVQRGAQRDRLKQENGVLMERVIEAERGVSLNEANSSSLRLVAAQIIDELEATLAEWEPCYTTLGDDDPLLMEMMISDLPLIEAAFLNLYVLLGYELEKMKNNLLTLKKSMNVIAKAVDVNFYTIQTTITSIWRIISVMSEIRTFQLEHGTALTSDQFSSLLDQAMVYPAYHQVLANVADRVVEAVAEDRSNVDSIEKRYRASKKEWLQEFLNRHMSQYDTVVLSSSMDTDIEVSEIDVTDALLRRLMGLYEKFLEYDDLDDAEFIMRIVVMVSNRWDFREARNLKTYFDAWKLAEEKVKSSIQTARIQNFSGR